jgi:hypothetical protein
MAAKIRLLKVKRMLRNDFNTVFFDIFSQNIILNTIFYKYAYSQPRKSYLIRHVAKRFVPVQKASISSLTFFSSNRLSPTVWSI